jgi:gliding motility-associated-like protein
MKLTFTFLILLWTAYLACAQKEDRIWAYGNASGLDFTGSPVAYQASSVENYHHYAGAGSASICDKEGNLLFYTNGAKIWCRDGSIMSGGILLSGYPMGPVSAAYSIWQTPQSAAIAPDPFDRNLYYVFHTWRNSTPNSFGFSDTCSLFYTVVDMSKNNGSGAVIASRKKILIDNRTDGALTIVRGDDCNVWVISHSIAGNAFKVYELTVNGLNMTPVISNTGLPAAPPFYYDNDPYLYSPARTGVRVSPDRNKLAHWCSQGTNVYGDAGPSFLELFDFNAATGQIQNPLPLVDVGINTLGVYDACFSPGSSKLYSSWRFPCLSCGHISQYDLTLATPAAVLASQNVVSGGTPVAECIKTGPDGRIYVAKGYGQVWSYPNASQGLFYIQQPELPGALCQFVNNNMLFQSFDSRGGSFPNEVVVLARDTVTSTKELLACGRDTLWLHADAPASNCLWEDNSTSLSRAVTQPGTYTLQYQQGCTERFDTFIVRFQPLPRIAWDSLTCYDPRSGRAYALPEDSTGVNINWKDNNGILSAKWSRHGDTLRNLVPGSYAVQLITSSGCDTTIGFTIGAFPETMLAVIPSEARIRYGDSIQLQASGALLYTWWPSGTVSNDTVPDPYVRPLQPTRYTVLGLNKYGCRDTAAVNVDIDYNMPVFIPNAFSPNGDGLNDVFRIGNITHQKLAAFRVFDRWGRQVFETADPAKGWDGNLAGTPCNAGTYYYLIIINYPDSNTRTFKGDLILLR